MLYKTTVEQHTLDLLIKLQTDNAFNNFYLAGGTSLSLQIGHRKSIDLDLFTHHDFDNDSLLEYLEENYNFELNYAAKNTLKGNINRIKVDFLSHKYKIVKDIIKIDNLRLLSIEDISAMKLNAIAGNGTRVKDFIDIYFILKQYTINDILHCYNIKYSNRNLLHIIKSLDYFADIDISDWPEMIKEKNLKLSDITTKISKEITMYSKNSFDIQ